LRVLLLALCSLCGVADQRAFMRSERKRAACQIRCLVVVA
jgi:hypothetical protein